MDRETQLKGLEYARRVLAIRRQQAALANVSQEDLQKRALKAAAKEMKSRWVKPPLSSLPAKEYVHALRNLECMADVDYDSDGYFVALKDGWHWERPGQHIIQEDDIAALKKSMQLIYRDQDGFDPSGNKIEAKE